MFGARKEVVESRLVEVIPAVRRGMQSPQPHKTRYYVTCVDFASFFAAGSTFRANLRVFAS